MCAVKEIGECDGGELKKKLGKLVQRHAHSTCANWDLRKGSRRGCGDKDWEGLRFLGKCKKKPSETGTVKTWERLMNQINSEKLPNQKVRGQTLEEGRGNELRTTREGVNEQHHRKWKREGRKDHGTQ